MVENTIPTPFDFKVKVDFFNNQKLLSIIKKEADDNFRTVEMHILYLISKHVSTRQK